MSDTLTRDLLLQVAAFLKMVNAGMISAGQAKREAGELAEKVGLALASSPELAEPTIVHGLWAGQPLCGFMPGALPGHWPTEHRWAQDIESISCPGCKLEAPKYKHYAEQAL